MSAAHQLRLLSSRYDRQPLEARWREFHEANPHVYAHFERLALQAARRGRRRFGAKAIWEVMRWEMALSTTEEEPRLNNNHVAYYVREFMRRNPRHASLFETRERTA